MQVVFLRHYRQPITVSIQAWNNPTMAVLNTHKRTSTRTRTRTHTHTHARARTHVRTHKLRHTSHHLAQILGVYCNVLYCNWSNYLITWQSKAKQSFSTCSSNEKPEIRYNKYKIYWHYITKSITLYRQRSDTSDFILLHDLSVGIGSINRQIIIVECLMQQQRRTNW